MAETIAIVDYGSGNLRSVQKALERAASEAGISAVCVLTDEAETIAAADRVVLPGVGAFAACMEGLRARDGAIAGLEHAVLVVGRPFLGICVGMQLLADRGLEFGETRGLGWIAGEVRALEPSPEFRVPHIGWNQVDFEPHPALDPAGPEDDFYFVHSYYFDPENDAHAMGFASYGRRFAAVVGRDNILGVQFHPEKSQHAGLALLKGFLAWRP